VLERIRTGGDRESAELAALTPQERRILELIAKGLTTGRSVPRSSSPRRP
jgi:DNA-binding NarL/FixJ family response regulator